MGKHLIYRQVLDVTFPTKKEATEGQNRLSQIYQQKLPDLLGEVFDELVPDKQYLSLERIELNMGWLDPDNFEDDLKNKLRSQLEDELLKNLQTAHLLQNRDRNQTSSTGSTSKKAASEEPKVYSPDTRALELFVYFVKTGQLPWWTDREEIKSPELLVSTLFQKNQSKHELDVLLKLFRTETYRRRIIHQFSDEVLGSFIALKLNSGFKSTLTDRILALHEDIYRIHNRRPLISLTRPNLRLLLWQSAFKYWLMKKSSGPESRTKFSSKIVNPKRPDSQKQSQLVTATHFQTYFIVLLNTLANKVNQQDISKIQDTSDKSSTVDKLVHRLHLEIQELGIQHGILGTTLSSVMKHSSWELRQMLTKLESEQQFSEKRKTAESYLKENQEHFEVQNAGLAIVAPFLPRFFDALGLVNEKAFITDEAAKRAALLLQYVAAEKTDVPEYELILNKVLCGIDIEEPLPKNIDISDRESEEIENLLNSVVEHWSALKRTSIKGLRDTFIKREGYLVPQQKGWKLIVERITPDVLIDHLPWGISIIKLPWNREIIRTEW
uniref:contractile injection system tape measure protein n=1 Tax=Candidatus Electrothrix sp. TaxID=2170559 RepID=UPI00405674DB